MKTSIDTHRSLNNYEHHLQRLEDHQKRYDRAIFGGLSRLYNTFWMDYHGHWCDDIYDDILAEGSNRRGN